MYKLCEIGVIIFGSVRFLSKKVTKPKLFFLKKKPKPNRNRVKLTDFGSVRFFRAKTGSNRFGSVFPVLARFSRFWLGFFGLARFFRFFRFGSVFFQFFSDSVRFGFFGFLLIKPNRTSQFFQKCNLFFFQFGFFGYFFSGFLSLIGFLVFLLSPSVKCEYI